MVLPSVGRPTSSVAYTTPVESLRQVPTVYRRPLPLRVYHATITRRRRRRARAETQRVGTAPSPRRTSLSLSCSLHPACRLSLHAGGNGPSLPESALEGGPSLSLSLSDSGCASLGYLCHKPPDSFPRPESPARRARTFPPARLVQPFSSTTNS